LRAGIGRELLTSGAIQRRSCFFKAVFNQCVIAPFGGWQSLMAITVIAKCSKNTLPAIRPGKWIPLQTCGVYRGRFAGN
jgi:hypothetical protein